MDLRISILLFNVLGWIYYAEGCDEDGVSRCEQQFAIQAGVSQADLEAGIVPEVTEDQLRIVCSAYDVFSQCATPYLLGCARDRRFLFQGIENAYHYTCNEGFQDHVEHHECLARNTVEAGVRACANALQIQLTGFFFLTRSQMCSAINDAVSCVSRAVSRVCGSAAAMHHVELEVRSLEPYTEYFTCEITPIPLLTAAAAATTTTKTAVAPTTIIWPYIRRNSGQNKGSGASDGGLPIGAIVGIIITILLLLLVGVCIAFFVVRRRKKGQANQEDRHVIANQTLPSSGNNYQDGGACYTDPPPAYINNAYEVVKY